jgi:hypothetical protein
MSFGLNGAASLVPLVELGDGRGRGRRGSLNGAARVVAVVAGYEEGCLDPAVTGFHGGALDLEAEMTRKEKSRTDSATDVSTVVNTGVLGFGFKPYSAQERR